MYDTSNAEKVLHVAILWHQHQPFYKDLITGTYSLPWVRLHATKDYYDMAGMLDEFPSIRLNFNLVPSLLIQLEDYGSGSASDPHLELTLKPASKLTQEDRFIILHDFFMANWRHMIEPHARYSQLLTKRGRYSTIEELKRIATYFSIQDLLDLQVWFNLSWMDPYWKKNDEFIGMLFAKGAHFTEEDKQKLILKQRQICKMVAHKHRELQEKGLIEISTSAFYHPIMPLIIDSAIAQTSNPHINLPMKRFSHPEDIEHQIQKAVECYVKFFGVKPRGMWPAEGSVSESILPMVNRHGFKWIASDEGILFRSLPHTSPREVLYKPYKIFNAEPLYMLFRHRELSDAISFQYSSWDGEAAARDIIKKLHQIRNSLSTTEEDNIVTIILDGENCWEYYKNDGHDFLKSLYRIFSEEEALLPTVTISDYLSRCPHAGTLKHLFPGSWINSNFDIWIGHPEHNSAWNYLAETRNFLIKHLQYHPEKKDTPETRKAWEEIYIAEGSDWNWWYGDEHVSSDDQEFDKLYRKHLVNVYSLMNQRIPDWLYVSIKGKVSNKRTSLIPIDLITPKIDGVITNYYEWQSAGFYRVMHAGGTMHRTDSVLFSFHYGFDLKNLYFRFDTKIQLDNLIFKQLTFKVVFLHPHKKELIFRIQPGGKLKEYALFSSDPFNKIKDLPSFAAKKVIEFAVPFDDLEPAERFNVEFMVVVENNLIEIERWPLNDSIVLEKPTRHFKMINWSV